ncbi:MAG: hypothetical protein CMO01_25565 [Thalassobius sp.]|nr:hypothetical protein [Thalassovita sp.]
MTKEEFFKLSDKYQEGKCTKEEISVLNEFCERVQIQDTTANWNLSEEERIKFRLYNSILKDINKEVFISEKQTFYFSPFKIAASITLLIGALFFIYKANYNNVQPSNITKATSRGQHLNITLTDGTTVALNASSSLTFPEKFEGGQRVVELKGEAFFDVKRDTSRPFIIKTSNSETTVLGTSFNINAYENKDETQVTVATGKVKVASAKDQSVYQILIPNQQASLSLLTNSITVDSVDLDKVIAWKENILYFDNTSMREVANTLENWYDIDIIIKDNSLNNCLISGKYKSDELSNILESLKFMQNISFEKTGEKEITLSGGNCN